MKKISSVVKFVKKHGLFPSTHTLYSPHDVEVNVDGRKVLLFASNNYLGMMKDPRVIEAAKQGLEKWGIGNGSARLLTGNLEMHQRLEDATAKFKHKEAAISFVTGYMANAGAISALAATYRLDLMSLLTGKTDKDRDTIIFSDEFNHASIVAGIRLSKCVKEIYKHRDVRDLETKLKKYSKSVRKIIASDGIFSMDGDIAPLPEMVSLAEKYDATIYLDDAHGTGIFGSHGRGLEDYFGIEGKVGIVMGTYTKAFGGVGGFVSGSNELIEYLKITAESFIFTAPIAPPVVYGLIKAIEIVGKETWRREKLLENAKYLRDSLKANGFDTLGSESQIIPVFIGDEKKAMKASEMLLEGGIFIPAARWPAVQKGKARLRVTVSCDHKKEHIDTLIEHLKTIKTKLNF